MLATILTIGFAGIALFVAASLASSLAKGLAASAGLRRELAGCETVRSVTVNSYVTSGTRIAVKAISARPSRRMALPAVPQAPKRQYAAA